MSQALLGLPVALGSVEQRVRGKRCRTSPVWAGAYREQEREVFGWDPYPYGIEPNRPTLEALTAYSFEHGLTSRRGDDLQ